MYTFTHLRVAGAMFWLRKCEDCMIQKEESKWSNGEMEEESSGKKKALSSERRKKKFLKSQKERCWKIKCGCVYYHA